MTLDMKAILPVLIALFAWCGVTQARTLATVALPGGKTLPYFVSDTPDTVAHALIAMHGYTRDANRTFDAAAAAAQAAGRDADTLIVAPIYPVDAAEAARCSFHGVPVAEPGNALWRCSTWSDGSPAQNDPAVTAFTAMDNLLAALLDSHPDVRDVTVAGFSAGAQFVQRYAGFAAPPKRPVALRYVVSDPGSFLYFDAVRPLPGAGRCPTYNDWKLGTNNLPTYLGRNAAAARATYAAAQLAYLEGALDTGSGPGTAYRLLDRSCGAELQGQYRLDRGENYAAYDRRLLGKGAHSLTIVPACAHSVTCVFPSPAARVALFGEP